MIASIISFFATIMVNRCLSMDEMLPENPTYKSDSLMLRFSAKKPSFQVPILGMLDEAAKKLGFSSCFALSFYMSQVIISGHCLRRGKK